MKNIFFTLFLFINTLAISQNNNCEVFYKVVICGDSTLKAKSERLNHLQQQAIKGSSKINLILKFNHYFSEFSLMESIEDEETKTAIAWSDCRKKIYNDLNANKSYYNCDANKMGITKKNEFLVYTNLGSNWIESTERKKIDGYDCYKATKTIEYSNSKGIQKKEIIAWYCPEMPYSFGPNGYCGLPGLILELTDKNITFIAKKVLFVEKNFDILIPTEGILISKEEYEIIIKHRFEEFKKNR